jgi:glucose-6-phosphate isomerase
LPLSILNDSAREATDRYSARFESEKVLERLRAIDERARADGLNAISPRDDSLVQIGMEIDARGHVTKNSLGVFDLSWQAQQDLESPDPQWVRRVTSEIDEIRAAIRAAHGTSLRFVIWAGMGGSIEDKTAYHDTGLLKGGPMFYSLDSTDPGKLKAIVEDLQHRAGEPIARLLPATLVVGMAMGMTSYEPVVNLEKLAGLYDKFKIDSTANFICMTLPGSVLDQFAGTRGYRRIPLQLDDRNSTAGRHSAPLTRGSLYPLALAGRDLREWIAGTFLTEAEIAEAFKLAAFLHAQGEAGRDKVTLLLPESWNGTALWTKQDFEESLGKSEAIGIKIVIGERYNARYYRKASDPRQSRLFVAVQRKGEAHPDGTGITALRGAKYPLAVQTLAGRAPLSRYMQFMHHVVLGIGYLRTMNFVTQPAVELYKSIAAEIYEEAKSAGGIRETKAWKSLGAGRRWRGAVALESPESLARAIRESVQADRIGYGEITFFGDMRYSAEGRAMHRVLENAARRVFRLRLKMPVDVCEGPAMNHSYHEMIIGHGRCFSIVILSQEQTRFTLAAYEPDYHMAQFLATRLALERKGRVVRAILVKDLSPESLHALGEFFSEAAALL